MFRLYRAQLFTQSPCPPKFGLLNTSVSSCTLFKADIKRASRAVSVRLPDGRLAWNRLCFPLLRSLSGPFPLYQGHPGVCITCTCNLQNVLVAQGWSIGAPGPPSLWLELWSLAESRRDSGGISASGRESICEDGGQVQEQSQGPDTSSLHCRCPGFSTLSLPQRFD